MSQWIELPIQRTLTGTRKTDSSTICGDCWTGAPDPIQSSFHGQPSAPLRNSGDVLNVQKLRRVLLWMFGTGQATVLARLHLVYGYFHGHNVPGIELHGWRR